MPSAHSATIIGLVTSVFFRFGTGGFELPMVLFFSFIVMFDAVGVRKETGDQGKMLNRLQREHPELFSGRRRVHFNEKAGHTVPEVAAGIIVGIVAGIIVHLIMG